MGKIKKIRIKKVLKKSKIKLKIKQIKPKYIKYNKKIL